MNLSGVIATFGGEEWTDLAYSRAYPSAITQEPGGAHLTISVAHEAEGTLASARNAGAAAATGDWLCFLDADDELAPGFVAAMQAAEPELRAFAGDVPTKVEALLTPAVAFVRSKKAAYRSRIEPWRDLRDGNSLCIGTLVPRPLFFEVGGFREWPMFEDWDLWQRCAIAGAKVVDVPGAVYVAYMTRRSRNRIAKIPERDYWHQRIGHSNLPDYYEPTTAEEDARKRLIPSGVRKKAA